MAKEKNPGDLYACADCNHILKSYKDYEHHRSYFHDKNIETIISNKCKRCGEDLDSYGCLNCWTIGADKLAAEAWPEY